MRRSVKIAAAVVVLGIGLALAFLFPRRPSAEDDLLTTPAGEKLVLRAAPAAGSSQTVPDAPPAAAPPARSRVAEPKGEGDATGSSATSPSHPSIPKPAKRPPPEMASQFDEGGEKSALRSGTSDVGIESAVASPPSDIQLSASPATRGDWAVCRTHHVVDGDTLARLAQRYLGASQRLGEIFDANRDVLASPDVLPIGVVLKIPPRSAAESRSPSGSGVPRSTSPPGGQSAATPAMEPTTPDSSEPTPESAAALVPIPPGTFRAADDQPPDAAPSDADNEDKLKERD